MNKVILTGRVTKDLELRVTAAGNQVTSFSLAVDRIKKGETDFFNCTAWNKLAETMAKYVAKGSKILVEGILQNRSYDDQQGQKRIVTDIVVSNVEFIDTKNRNEQTQANTPVYDSYDSELPF